MVFQLQPLKEKLFGTKTDLNGKKEDPGVIICNVEADQGGKQDPGVTIC